MCVNPLDMFKKPSMPAQNAPPPPPPQAPPPPQSTTQGLTVGDKRQDAPIKNFLKKSLGANKSSLVVPIGGVDPAGTGLNIPR